MTALQHTLDIRICPDLHEKDVEWSEGERKQKRERVKKRGDGGGSKVRERDTCKFNFPSANSRW